MEIVINHPEMRVFVWPYVGIYDSRDVSVMLAMEYPYQLSKWMYTSEEDGPNKRINLKVLQEMEPQVFQDCIRDLIYYNKIRPWKKVKQIINE
jgi:hypothetical protein